MNKKKDMIRFFLTYSRVPKEWNKEYVLEELKEKFMYKIKTKEKNKYESKIIAYIIAEELHQEGVGEGDYERGKHYHCYIELDKRTRIKDMSYLDIGGIHGNYQGVRNKLKVIGYCRKYGNYIEKGFPGIEQKELLEAKDEKELKGMLFDKMGIKEKIEYYREEKNREEIDRARITIDLPVYAFQKFFEPLKSLIERISGYGNKRRPKGILVSGPSETGKTSFGYRIAKETGEGIIVVRDLKELEHYRGERIILFDELKKEVIEENGDFFKMVISEIQARTKPYYGSRLLKYPRLIILATNEDIEKWEIDVGLKKRLIVVKTSIEEEKYKVLEYDEEGRLVEIKE